MKLLYSLFLSVYMLSFSCQWVFTFTPNKSPQLLENLPAQSSVFYFISKPSTSSLWPTACMWPGATCIVADPCPIPSWRQLCPTEQTGLAPGTSASLGNNRTSLCDWHCLGLNQCIGRMQCSAESSYDNFIHFGALAEQSPMNNNSNKPKNTHVFDKGIWEQVSRLPKK